VALLEVQDLRTEIRLKSTVYALDGVSLSVDEGETLGVVGESGCGKTMTALSIMQLLPNGGASPAARSSSTAGSSPSSVGRRDAKVRGNEIGMIFQDPMTSLNPTMTIGAQIAESVLLHRDVGKKEALERAVEVLELVGMPRRQSERSRTTRTSSPAACASAR
jgi:peptide/nickel transport system ATP-binding protein